VSKEVKDYLNEIRIEQRYTTPLWPRANGEVERQNRSLLKSMREAHAEGKNWREELKRFLLVYRSTPHSTTGKGPVELLFRRQFLRYFARQQLEQPSYLKPYKKIQ